MDMNPITLSHLLFIYFCLKLNNLRVITKSKHTAHRCNTHCCWNWQNLLLPVAVDTPTTSDLPLGSSLDIFFTTKNNQIVVFACVIIVQTTRIINAFISAELPKCNEIQA